MADAHHSARVTLPVGWQHAHMWALPQAREGRALSRSGAGEPQLA